MSKVCKQKRKPFYSLIKQRCPKRSKKLPELKDNISVTFHYSVPLRLFATFGTAL